MSRNNVALSLQFFFLDTHSAKLHARTHARTRRPSSDYSLFPTCLFSVPRDRRNQSSSERLNTLGCSSLLGETNSIERHESTKNARRRDLKECATPDAFVAQYRACIPKNGTEMVRNGADKVDNSNNRTYRYVHANEKLSEKWTRDS
jgi:hypothetical protein